MRIESFTFDARDPAALARWWAEALGWTLVFEDPDGVEVNLSAAVRPDGTSTYPELSFVRVDDPEAGQERIHLDLNSHSLDEQQATVDRLLALGARRSDVGQADDAPFVVLADPEGNNFCVLDPRPEYAELGSLTGFTLAAHDANLLRDLWAVATGWQVRSEEPGYVVLAHPDAVGPLVEIITRPTMAHDDRKDRVHLDVAPDLEEPQADVVALLEALGATRADVGQSGDESWVVLQDPEGNELCVLSQRARAT